MVLNYYQSFVSGYNINAQIKINEDELENLIAELS